MKQGENMSKNVKMTIIIMSAVVVAVAVALAVPLGIYVNRNNKSTSRINSLYEKSYYETVVSLNNVETKLSKVNVVNTSTVKSELLLDIWKECDIAVTNLSQLGSDNENLQSVIKFLNQLGDYSYYLGGKLRTNNLSNEEKANIQTFYGIICDLNDDLAEVSDNMISGDEIKADTLADFSAISGTVKNYSSIDYPELIYDGPFSDGLNEREPKFLYGKSEISEEQATAVIAEKFEGATDINKMGDSEATIKSYIYAFKVNGAEYNAFVTKLGGYVISINRYAEVTDPKLTEEACVTKATAFLEKLGYANMSAVWVFNNNSTVYVNFAYKDGEVIYYPDLIKVKVALDTGEVIGMEAQNYHYNHTTRNIPYDKSNENKISVSDVLTVTATNYCVIPTDWNAEVYCKEVIGNYDGMTYYLYYDMRTGEEIRAMVVIDENGNLLI